MVAIKMSKIRVNLVNKVDTDNEDKAKEQTKNE